MKIEYIKEARYAQQEEPREFLFDGYESFYDRRDVQQALSKVEVTHFDYSDHMMTNGEKQVFVTIVTTDEKAERLHKILGQIHLKRGQPNAYGGYQSTANYEQDAYMAVHPAINRAIDESRYVGQKRTPRQLGQLIRRGIIKTFPSWKPLRRLQVAVGLSGDVENSITVSLKTLGEKEGLLHDNVSRVGKIIQDATGRSIKDHSSYIDGQYGTEEVRYWLDSDLQEAKYTEPPINKARFKRMYREVQELIDGELDEYESKQDMYVMDSLTMSFDEIEKILTKKFGAAEKFDIPEFTVPWFRYTADNFWILLKSYGGIAQVEVMPAKTRGSGARIYTRPGVRSDDLEQIPPYQRYLREAAYAHSPREVAKRYRQVRQDAENPNMWLDDLELFFSGAGYLSGDKAAYLRLQVTGNNERHAEQRVKDHLKEWKMPYTTISVEPHNEGPEVLYNVSIFYAPYKKIQEAKYAEPTIRRLFGVLYVDDDRDWVPYRHVKMTIKCGPPDKTSTSISYECEIISADNPSTLIEIKPGDRCWFTRDEIGWVVSGDNGGWNLADR